MPVLSPLVLFEDTCPSSPDLGARFFGLGDKLRAFWQSLRGDAPRLAGHPMLANPSCRSRAIPIIIHGDGVRFTNKQGNRLL
eukprot:8692384-Alexandrium_andersonii.AAC.1